MIFSITVYYASLSSSHWPGLNSEWFVLQTRLQFFHFNYGKCVFWMLITFQPANHRSARNWLIFCLVLSSCCPYVNQDVNKQVRGYKNRYIQIDKPPTCKLDEGTYRLMSEPEGDIKPQVSLFACACVSAHMLSFILQLMCWKLQYCDCQVLHHYHCHHHPH